MTYEWRFVLPGLKADSVSLKSLYVFLNGCKSCDTWSNWFLLKTVSVDDYLHCLERGRAASAKMSAFLRRSLQPQVSTDSSKAG